MPILRLKEMRVHQIPKLWQLLDEMYRHFPFDKTVEKT